MAEATLEATLEAPIAQETTTLAAENARRSLVETLIALSMQGRGAKGKNDLTELARVKDELNLRKLDAGDPAVDLAFAFAEADIAEETQGMDALQRLQLEMLASVAKEEQVKSLEKSGALTEEQAKAARDDIAQSAQNAIKEATGAGKATPSADVQKTIEAANAHANAPTASEGHTGREDQRREAAAATVSTSRAG